MSGLEDVYFLNTNLTTVQLTEIYTLLADRKPQWLRKIKLSFNDDRSVPSDLLDRAELYQSVEIID